jgi:chromosome segregation protein
VLDHLQAVTVKSLDRSLRCPSSRGRATLIESDGPAGPPTGGDTLLARTRAPTAIAALLRRVRVADSLQTAVSRRNELADGESFVTREGVSVGQRWIRLHRSDDPQVGVIARGDEIKRLRESTQVTARRSDEVAKALADTRFQLERLEEARAQAQTEATRRQELLADAKAKLAASRAEIDQARQRAGALDRAAADLAAEQQALVTAVDEGTARHAAATARQRDLAAMRDEFERERQTHLERVATARTEASSETAQAIAIRGVAA